MFKTCVLIVALLGLSASNAFAKSIKVSAKPIERFLSGSEEKIFGRLEFLGGMELSSSHEKFGGISAFRFVNKNRFMALTDKARVITGTLERDGSTPTGLSDVRIKRIKDSKGRTITGKNDKDSESLAISGGHFFVGYERNDRIVRLLYKKRSLFADTGYEIDLNVYGFPSNKGPEALALHPQTGELFAFAEHALNADGNHRGFAIKGGKVQREITVKLRDGFSLTDADFLPNGDLILLERYYNPFLGAYMRLRLIDKKTLLEQDVIDGEVLIDADNSYEIDNMEALDISKMPDGSTRLTLVSDDNFSGNQRSLLLEFKLLD